MLKQIGMWVVVLAMAGLVLAWGLAGRSFAGSPWGDQPTRRYEGPITVTMTPVEMRGDLLLVQVRVDTHVGNLANLDLQRQTRLIDGERSLAPVQPVPLGGHHSGGTLAFAVGSAPERFEIVIANVGTLGDISLRWP